MGKFVTWYFTETAGEVGLDSEEMTALVYAAQKSNSKLFSEVRHIHGPANCPHPEHHSRSLQEIIESTGFFFLSHEDNEFRGAVEWECGSWMVSVYDRALELKFHYLTMPDKRTAQRVAKLEKEVLFRIDRRAKRIKALCE